MVIAFSLEHRVGSEQWEYLSKMYYERNKIELKTGNDFCIGFLAITGIDTDMVTNIAKFHFQQIR